MSADDRLHRLIGGDRFSQRPKGNYKNITRWGDLVFVSGKSAGRSVDGKMPKGRLGQTLSLDDGIAFAREAALELLLTLCEELDRSSACNKYSTYRASSMRTLSSKNMGRYSMVLRMFSLTSPW